MKTSKEFIERLQTDEAFAKEINEALQGKDLTEEVVVRLAADAGYELNKEELKALADEQMLSDEELGKVAGGTTPLAAVLSIASVGVTIMVSTGIYSREHGCGDPGSGPSIEGG